MYKIAVHGRGTVGLLALLKILPLSEKRKDLEVWCIYDKNTPVTSVGEASTFLVLELLKEALKTEEALNRVIRRLSGTQRKGTSFNFFICSKLV